MKKILKTILITIAVFLITLLISVIPLLIWVSKQPPASEDTVIEQTMNQDCSELLYDL